MPVNADSYKNGKIYRIWSLKTDKIYIGSTADTLSNRFCNHKGHYKRWLNGGNSYYSSFKLFEEFGVENCKIDLEHVFSCNSKAELCSEEGRVQRIHKDILVNNNIAGRTFKEFYADNKDKISEKNKEYYVDNRYKIKEIRKQYVTNNKDKIYEKIDCDCGGKYKAPNKCRHFNSAKHQKFIKDNQSLVVAC